jgi:hypothetical protein
MTSTEQKMAKFDDRVTAACEAHWETWKSDCSGFLKAVAASLGIDLKGQANDIIDAVSASPFWSNLENDHELATTKASQGFLVIGGAKKNPNGHVVVVVKSTSTRYPVAYWGQLNRTGKKSTTINWSWRPAQIPSIRYFAIAL